MLAGDQDLSQTSSVLTAKGYLNKKSLCVLQNQIQNVILNIPLTVVKNCRWQNVLKESFCQLTARRYSSTHVNDLELKT